MDPNRLGSLSNFNQCSVGSLRDPQTKITNQRDGWFALGNDTFTVRSQNHSVQALRIFGEDEISSQLASKIELG